MRKQKALPAEIGERYGVWLVDIKGFVAITRAVGKILKRKVPKDETLIIAPNTKDGEELARDIARFLRNDPQSVRPAQAREKRRIGKPLLQ